MSIVQRSWVRRLVPIALVGVISCAYYNTFFVAKKSFRDAERSVEASETDKLPSDARRNYETTIRQCRKVLDKHGGSRWADDAIYLMAASYYGIGEYDSVLVRLEQLQTEFPNSSFLADAYFLGGMTHTELREYEEAAALFDRVVEEYPDYRRTDEILFTRAETAVTLRDKPRAIRFYEELTREFPKSPLAGDALQRAGELHYEAGNYDSASIYFDRLLSVVRDEKKEIDASILQAQTLIRLDRAEEALELLEKVEPREARREQTQAGRRRSGLADDVARIRLQRAAALNRLGRHSEAIETLREVTERFATSRFAVEVQFQIGYIYETLMDSLEVARSVYEKVAQLPGRSIFKEQARQRSTALKSLEELRLQEGSGDAALEARAEAALRIAEILLFDRNLVDEAVGKYKEVEEQFPETRVAARAGYALAYIQWKMKGDTVRAQEAFRELVGRYPASTQARDAIELLAVQGADTSGLRDLLVAPAPETTAVVVDSVAVDSALVEKILAADSLRLVSVDSLSASVIGRKGAPGTDSSRAAPPDSIAAPADTVTEEPSDLLRREIEEVRSRRRPGRGQP